MHYFRCKLTFEVVVIRINLRDPAVHHSIKIASLFGRYRSLVDVVLNDIGSVVQSAGIIDC